MEIITLIKRTWGKEMVSDRYRKSEMFNGVKNEKRKITLIIPARSFSLTQL